MLLVSHLAVCRLYLPYVIVTALILQCSHISTQHCLSLAATLAALEIRHVDHLYVTS